jgi:hypothetical protein
MTIEVTSSCPFGHTCEKIVGGKIDRCKLYIPLAGRNPQTGEDIDEWNCSLVWSVIMMVENANTNRGTQAALESFRNEATNQTQTTNQILLAAAQGRLNGNNLI